MKLEAEVDGNKQSRKPEKSGAGRQVFVTPIVKIDGLVRTGETDSRGKNSR